MSGTINLALTQQFDTQGDPLSGGLLYFFTAGTTTPQTPFQDTALTIAHPNPIILDASGRVPMFYVADGFIKIRLTDKNGVVIIAADQLLVIGPSSGGGGGGSSFDPNTVLQTGDIKCRYGTGTLTGFARCNGNTIGTTGSSATELAGPTAQALYEYLWPFTNILLDSATKGASAVADFGALKRLILPDLRGRVIAGIDDMGALAGAASRLTPTYFGTSAIALGAVGGDEKHTLLAANIAQHLHGIASTNFTSGMVATSIGNTIDHAHDWGGVSGGPVNSNATVGLSLSHDHNYGSNTLGGVTGGGGAIGTGTVNRSGAVNSDTSGTGDAALTHYHAVSGRSGGMVISGAGNTTDHRHTFSGTTDNYPASAATPLATATPAMVMTIYIKL